MAQRKSTRVNRRKWPCGTCGLQCNDNLVFCEGCHAWHHAKCDSLSLKDLTVLNRLTEDYLCHSCTHKNGSFDFHQALQRLENASKLGTLETAAKVERIFLRNTPLPQRKAEELLFGRSSPDLVARDILKRLGKFHFSHIYCIVPTIYIYAYNRILQYFAMNCHGCIYTKKWMKIASLYKPCTYGIVEL